MVADLRRTRPAALIRWLDPRGLADDPNASSEFSDVTLLDDELARAYGEPERFGQYVLTDACAVQRVCVCRCEPTSEVSIATESDPTKRSDGCEASLRSCRSVRSAAIESKVQTPPAALRQP